MKITNRVFTIKPYHLPILIIKILLLIIKITILLNMHPEYYPFGAQVEINGIQILYVIVPVSNHIGSFFGKLGGGSKRIIFRMHI
jgi:hypothetical protein